MSKGVRGYLMSLTLVFIAVPTHEGDIFWLCHPTLCMSPSSFPKACPPDVRAYQAAKDVSSSYDALVDLLESIEHFLNRLKIYTGLSPTGAMAEIIVKILVEVLSTLALVTQQIKQKRPGKSESTLPDTSLDCTQHSEIREETLGRE